MTLRIGIFGHYGNWNLGDESTILAVVANLRSMFPDAELACFSINPKDSERRYSLPAWPIRHLPHESASSPRSEAPIDLTVGTKAGPDAERANAPAGSVRDRLKALPLVRPLGKSILGAADALRETYAELVFLRKAYVRLKQTDVLMVTGSNQFLDNFGGPWGFPYTLWKWSVLAAVCQTKLLYVSVGAGPIDHWMSRWFIRGAIKRAQYVSFRDEGSKALMESLGSNVRSFVYPDLSHGIRSVVGPLRDAPTNQRDSVVVGINTMPVYDSRYWCEPNSGEYEKYLDKIADLSRRLLKRGARIRYFSTQPKDDNVADDVIARLNDERVTVIRCDSEESNSVARLLETIESLDVVFATRFHGTLLSLSMGKPVIAISYHRKIASLMSEMGQSRYCTVFEDVSAAELERLYIQLINEKDDAIGRIRLANLKMSQSLKSQYGRIKKVIEDEAT